MYQIDVTNDHDQSCDKVTWYWGVRWKRIYGNYWDEFYSDSAYTADGEWNSFDISSAGSFTDSRNYQDTHYDNEYSPYVYTNNEWVYLFAMVRIERSVFGISCGAYTSAYGQIHYVQASSDNTFHQIEVVAYGGRSVFYFELLWD